MHRARGIAKAIDAKILSIKFSFGYSGNSQLHFHNFCDLG